MKTLIIMSVLLASVASAEIYRWEDASGVYFTDNYSSVPEKYREKAVAEPTKRTGEIEPHVGTIAAQQPSPVAVPESKAAVHEANLEQQRQAAETNTRQPVNTREMQTTLQSLSKFIVIGILLASFLFIMWIVTIVDIVRSEFVTPTIKRVWMLVVVLLPLLGMVPYMILGSHQKSTLE